MSREGVAKMKENLSQHDIADDIFKRAPGRGLASFKECQWGYGWLLQSIAYAFYAAS